MRLSTRLLGGFFVLAGIAHFLRPAAYAGIVPPQLPDPQLLVILSGLGEIAGGVGVWWRPTRRAAGVGLIVLLVVVFPANVTMLVQGIDAHRATWWLVLLWLRLPLQPLMVWWVWQAAVRSCEDLSSRKL
jgi:uncharacterized membrane protein